MQDLKVSLLQSDLYWENAEKNLEAFEKKISTLDGDTDLIVLPEMFNTGFTVKPKEVAETIKGPTFRWLQKMALTSGSVITGSFIVQDDNDFYNRLVWMQPNGFYLTYDKRHLFRMGGEHHRFSSGKTPLLVTHKGWKIRPLVCYDLRFPVWSKNVYHDGMYEYDVLIYVANWPAPRRQVWDALLTARALENQSYVLGVNCVGKDGNGVDYSGGTIIRDAKGRIIKKAQDHKVEAITASLSYQELLDFREKFKVGMDWDRFEIKL
ncbi:MAG TPA: amidohydrolase [Bacteroidales bacterium]|nr:amidohydrolase [Bacteroidales bacterium]